MNVPDDDSVTKDLRTTSTESGAVEKQNYRRMQTRAVKGGRLHSEVKPLRGLASRPRRSGAKYSVILIQHPKYGKRRWHGGCVAIYASWGRSGLRAFETW